MKNSFQLINMNDLPQESLAGLSHSTYAVDFESSALGAGNKFVYNEMSDFPVTSRTDLESLQENMKVLSELSDRLEFMSKEIKYLLNLK